MTQLIALIFNPYAWLALVLVVLGAYAKGHHDGDGSASARVMHAWNIANDVATEARQKRIETNAKLIADAKAKADKERNDYAKKMDAMRADLRSALNELRNRPARPANGQAPGAEAGTSGAGTAVGCTGAGLYRDDAELLTWRADAAQRIRIQRDACYRQYDAARETVSRLQCQ